MNYWLHRISHCWDISKPLFDEGFLTIGWSAYSNGITAEKATASSGVYDRYMKDEMKESSRSRWNLWYFGQMQVGDTVIIPLYEGKFAIAEVAQTIRPISDLPVERFKSLSSRDVILANNGIAYSDCPEVCIDLGFYIRITNVKTQEREYAKNDLQSRMKMFQTNGNVSDLAQSIEQVRNAKGPVDLYDIIAANTAKHILQAIVDYVSPDKFELLIRWYMDRLGASKTYKLSKNEPGKTDGADADIIAEFATLGITIYIQAKEHVGVTSDWAVKQISRYKEQRACIADDWTYLAWVISTAAFSADAIDLAKSSGVRLIDGDRFARMLLDAGISDIDEFLSLCN